MMMMNPGMMGQMGAGGMGMGMGQMYVSPLRVLHSLTLWSGQWAHMVLCQGNQARTKAAVDRQVTVVEDVDEAATTRSVYL